MTNSEKIIAVHGMIAGLQTGYQDGLFMDLFAVVSANKNHAPKIFKSPPLEFSEATTHYAAAIDAFYTRHQRDTLVLKMVRPPEALACASDQPFPSKEICHDVDTLMNGKK